MDFNVLTAGSLFVQVSSSFTSLHGPSWSQSVCPWSHAAMPAVLGLNAMRCFRSVKCLRSHGMSSKWSMLDQPFISVQVVEAVSCLHCLFPLLCSTSSVGGKFPVYERPWFSHLSTKLNKKNRLLNSTRRKGHLNLERH